MFLLNETSQCQAPAVRILPSRITCGRALFIMLLDVAGGPKVNEWISGKTGAILEVFVFNFQGEVTAVKQLVIPTITQDNRPA